MLSGGLCQMCTTLTRKKRLDSDLLSTPLNRCLNLFDVALLGIGHMVGAGIYVVTGTVARDVAGPGIVLSYLFASIAAVLSSLCYAEFGARVPKAGSAYTYTYVMLGEVFAFFIGWNMILEHIIGVASIGRAWSGSFDSLFDGAIHNATMEHIGSMHVRWLSDYIDITAWCFTLLIVVLVATGAKISTNFNSVFTVINLSVLLAIISIGLYFADIHNWTDESTGGFLPFGLSGVIGGAGSCFFAYIGFEGIAVAGEEIANPSRTIPRATGLAMCVASVMYIACSAVLTMMVPWTDIDVAAPFPTAFTQQGFHWAKYLVGGGSLVGITTASIGTMFALPRCVYAMATDGLIFKCLSYVNPVTQTPLVAVIVFGLVTSFTAMVFDLDVLVELMSIGTLFGYTFVAVCVIVLHYEPVDSANSSGLFILNDQQVVATASAEVEVKDKYKDEDSQSLASITDDTRHILGGDHVTSSLQQQQQCPAHIGRPKKRFLEVLPFLGDLPPGRATVAAVFVMSVSMTGFLALLFHGMHLLNSGRWWSWLLLIVFVCGVVLSFGVLLAHERNSSFTTFQVPMSPLLPALSIMFNISMMLLLNRQTWLRLAVWMVVGFAIYFSYGIWNSVERQALLNKDKTVVSYSGLESRSTAQPQQQQPSVNNDTSSSPSCPTVGGSETNDTEH